MRCVGILIVAIFLLSGCETFSINQYSLSQQNTAAIQNAMIKGGIISLAVGEFTSAYPGPFEARCGVNSLIKLPNNTPPEKYIRDALIDEIKDAGGYSLDQIEAGRVLTGHLDRFTLDGDSGAWVIQVTVSLNTGDVYTVSETYQNEEASCSKAASGLVPAVQELIYKIVSHPMLQRKAEDDS